MEPSLKTMKAPVLTILAKTVVGGLLGFFVASMFGLTGLWRLVTIVAATLPAPAVMYVFASEQNLEKQLDSAGWPKETRKFSAHLTLCRIRNSKAGFKLAQLAQEYEDFVIGTMSADSVTVYQSQLTPEGPIYTKLGNYELQ